MDHAMNRREVLEVMKNGAIGGLAVGALVTTEESSKEDHYGIPEAGSHVTILATTIRLALYAALGAGLNWIGAENLATIRNNRGQKPVMKTE
jgi:hypothetical protein